MIHATELYFRYPHQNINALDGMTLDLPAGKTVLLSGPTGCGKSTLGLALCGAIPRLIQGRLSGHLAVNDMPVANRPVRDTARDLGFLMQNVEYQTFTDRVSDEVAFGLENFRLPETEMDFRIQQALDLVDAGHLIHRPLETLSAGERQRVMLAALLALDQKVLVLDEPLAYLDHAARRRFLSLISDIAGNGRSVLIFEHRRDIIRAMGHPEIYMEAGRRAVIPSVDNEFPAVSTCIPKNTELAVDHVSFGWTKDDQPLLSEISFDVKQHESVVLLGENGSGKTTLMAMAMGLLKPNTGRITTCGLNAGRTKPAGLAKCATLVFQRPDHQLFLPYVLDEIRAQAVDSEAADRELSAMGLEGLKGRHPRSLSMGQKRRLTLAVALARRPRLLLLDEPSVGQDDSSLALVIRRLDRFICQGGALLTATHDERVARALAHRVVCLHQGKMVEKKGEA